MGIGRWRRNKAKEAGIGKKRVWVEVAAIVAVIVAVWLPRTLKLDQFVTPDEELWLNRSANFYMALAQRDFKDTYQKEHPGVPIMWSGALAYLLDYPGYRGSGVGQLNTMQFTYYMQNSAPVKLLDILKTARLIVVALITLALTLAYLYTRRLIGLLAAFLGFLLIAFDPFLLALTRLLHLDGLMTALMLLSLVSYLSYLKGHRPLDLVVSGTAAGFCWLTKSPGFFLGFVIAFISLATVWQERKQAGRSWGRRLGEALWPVAAWAAAGTLVYFIFWPAMWSQPIDTLVKVFAEAEGYAEKGHFTSIFFNGQIIESGDLGWRYSYFYPLTYVWRATPLVLGGLGLAIWGFGWKRRPFEGNENRLFVVSMVFLVVGFTMLMTVGQKKFDRYLLPVYPALDLLAGMGWAALVLWINIRLKTRAAKAALVAVAALALGGQFALVINTFPYYFSYYNPILGGAKQAEQVMQIGWGEGLDQAARYLNQKANAKDLNVYAWYSGGSFSYFFDGNAFYLAPLLGEREGELEKFNQADYAVIYIHQWQRDLPKKVLDELRERTPEKRIFINGIEYVRIYRLRGGKQ